MKTFWYFKKRYGFLSHRGKLHFYPFLQECIIDEDCETGKYCQFSTFEYKYKCQLCKTQHTVSPE